MCYVKEFSKFIPKPWVISAENTMEIIIDQSWGEQPFPWNIPIVKFLNSPVWCLHRMLD